MSSVTMTEGVAATDDDEDACTTEEESNDDRVVGAWMMAGGPAPPVPFLMTLRRLLRLDVLGDSNTMMAVVSLF